MQYKVETFSTISCLFEMRKKKVLRTLENEEASLNEIEKKYNVMKIYVKLKNANQSSMTVTGIFIETPLLFASAH
jgi:hypothetical protein